MYVRYRFLESQCVVRFAPLHEIHLTRNQGNFEKITWNRNKALNSLQSMKNLVKTNFATNIHTTYNCMVQILF